MEPLYWVGVRGFRTWMRLQGLRFTITGSEHFPQTGGAVMTINHTGYLDFAYAGLAALEFNREIRFMAKDAVFRHPVLGPLMRGLGQIPVDRAAGAEAFADAVQALRAGEVVAVYPEATISRSFELKEFKTGAARMAQEAGVPVVPVVVWGAQRVWTKDHPRRLGRSNFPILVAAGPRVDIGPDEDVLAATARIRSVMEASLHRLQEAYPPLSGDDLVFVPARLGGRAPTLEQAARLDREELATRAAPLGSEADERPSHP